MKYELILHSIEMSDKEYRKRVRRGDDIRPAWEDMNGGDSVGFFDSEEVAEKAMEFEGVRDERFHSAIGLFHHMEEYCIYEVEEDVI